VVLGKTRPKRRCGSSYRGRDAVRGPPESALRVTRAAHWTASERRDDEPHRRFHSSLPANASGNPHRSGSSQVGISLPLRAAMPIWRSGRAFKTPIWHFWGTGSQTESNTASQRSQGPCARFGPIALNQARQRARWVGVHPSPHPA
jgi:hypothetical protein